MLCCIERLAISVINSQLYRHLRAGFSPSETAESFHALDEKHLTGRLPGHFIIQLTSAGKQRTTFSEDQTKN